MKGLRKILRGSWTAKKTNEWVLNKAGVKRELLDTVKARIARTILWSHHEETRELPGERDNARNNARCTAREEDHARPGWTTSRCGQDSRGKVVLNFVFVSHKIFL